MTQRIICLLIGYAFGLFQTSYIYGKIHGVDIRTKGSGNAGTTNALRTFGKLGGFLTALGDVMKCILAVIVIWLIYRNTQADIIKLLKIYASAGVILGHNFPFYLKFRGGKGIAATCGMILAFLDWHLILIGAILFFASIAITKFVSVGSLTLSACFLIGVIVSGQLGVYSMTQASLIEMYIIVALLTLMAFIKHRGNISRLLHGNERKLSFKKSGTDEP